MRSLKHFALFLALLLVLIPLSSCKGGSSGGSESGSGEGSSTDRPPVVYEPEDTAPTIVASPSLDSEDEILELGFTANGIILSAERSNGAGSVLERLNDKGKPIWRAVADEGWAVKPNVAIPEGFPTLVVPAGTAITVCNKTGYEITSDQYVNFSTAETYNVEALPEGAGIYIRMITVNLEKPTDSFDEVAEGMFFGECRYFLIVSFE